MKKLILFLSATLVLSGIFSYVSATPILTNDEVTATFFGPSYPPVFIAPGTATVGPGDEFRLYLLGGRVINIDVDATSISFQYNGAINNASFQSTATVTLSDIDFGAGIGEISLVESISPGDQSVLFKGNTASFTDDSIALTLGGVWSGDGRVLINLIEAGAPVPEPATLILFGLGLLGFAGINRRKSLTEGFPRP